MTKKTASQLETMAMYRNCTVDKLDSYDFKMFQNEADAKKWLEKYSKVEKSLTPLKKRSPEVKASILYKKRYMIQTILGEKKQTFRTSENTIEQMNKVKKGDLFRLYDQKNEITVKLTNKKYIKGEMKYEFEHVR